MVETAVRGHNIPYLLPLIDDLPLDEKIEKGRKMFHLVTRDQLERLLALLAYADDPLTRILALYTMADLLPNPALVPVIESKLDDSDPSVREVAEYAAARAMGREAHMPEIMDTIHKLKTFSLFEGLGTRELHAVASIAKPQAVTVGEVVIRAGEDNPSIYLIISGQITVYQDYGTPQQKELRTTEADGYLNFVPMFANVPPANTSVVTQDGEMLVLPQSQFHEMMRVYPQIGLNLLKLAALLIRQLGVTA